MHAHTPLQSKLALEHEAAKRSVFTADTCHRVDELDMDGGQNCNKKKKSPLLLFMLGVLLFTSFLNLAHGWWCTSSHAYGLAFPRLHK